jgi:predicted  nucleic acid-binding Zn-ribbon protein
MTTGFNTLVYAEKLEQGGFTEEQAKAAAHALADAIQPLLASKEDLRGVETRVTQKIDAVDAKIDRVEASLRLEMTGLRHDMDIFKHDLDMLRHDMVQMEERLLLKMSEQINKSKVEMIVWMFGVLVVQSGVTAVLFKFLR